MAADAGLTAEEIGEIQRLLGRLDFDPGSEAGVLTAETVEAIRSYQEMAGLPADGEANAALLEELRTVVELYGG
jgi:membrane-bound lytic murein transglycosylase B